jgi:hypothetical protein
MGVVCVVAAAHGSRGLPLAAPQPGRARSFLRGGTSCTRLNPDVERLLCSATHFCCGSLFPVDRLQSGARIDYGHVPWSKGKLMGQEQPLKPKDVWAIRFRLQLEHRTRDLAREIAGSGRWRPAIDPKQKFFVTTRLLQPSSQAKLRSSAA